MISDLQQTELDIFEEAVLNDLWGGTTPTAKANVVMAFAGIDLNKIIQKFEAFTKPFMTDQGLVKGSLLKAAASLKYPKFAEMIPESDFRLIEAYQTVAPLVQIIGSKLK